MKGFTDSPRPISRIARAVGRASRTPSWRPTRAKASRTMSSWSVVCVAITEVREPAGTLGHGRAEHRVGEHAAVEQLPPEGEGVLHLADDHGDDRRLAPADVEAQA